MTDREALIERLEDAQKPGTSSAQRRRIMREAAAYLRTIGALVDPQTRSDPPPPGR